MRRVLLPFVIVTVILIAGCSEAASPGETSGVTVGTVATVATQEPAGTPTYQAVVLGPGDEPVGSADVAPRLFRDEPSIIEALESTVPADMAERGAGMGDHLIVAILIAGVAESESGVEVYADMREVWYSLDGGKPLELGGGAYPVRIRLTKVGDVFRVDGVDKPKDGGEYLSSLDEMFPGWARDLVGTGETENRLQQAIDDAAIEWAAPTGHVPTMMTTTTAV
jgi:hypothetical protein